MLGLAPSIAAAAMEEGDRYLKNKEAGASEGGDTLRRNEEMVNLLAAMKSTVEGQPAGAGKKRKGAVASEAGDDALKKEASASEAGEHVLVGKEARASEAGDGALKKVGSVWKEGEILKLRKEATEASLLWREKYVPGVLDRWLQKKAMPDPEEAQAPGVGKKRKKVVRDILPNELIEFIIKDTYKSREEHSEEEIAKYPQRFRQGYAIDKVINATKRAYNQALITQYRAFGYAYDEREVTDDEEMLKN